MFLGWQKRFWFCLVGAAVPIIVVLNLVGLGGDTQIAIVSLAWGFIFSGIASSFWHWDREKE